MTGMWSAGAALQKQPIHDPAAKRSIVGILVDPVERAEAAALVIEAARDGRPFSVSALAVHGVMTGVLDAEHRHRLNQLDLVVCDGQPVRWALNLLHHANLRERVYGPMLMLEILRGAEADRIPVFFFGCTADVLEKLCRRMRTLFPSLQIAGAEPSRFATVSLRAADELAGHIRDSGARIVFAGLGCPRQEVWAYEYRERLGVPIVAVGAAFPFCAGSLPQAPKWMQDLGIEWLFRLATEPRRLWRRYLVLSPMYLALVACQWLGFRFSGRSRVPKREILCG